MTKTLNVALIGQGFMGRAHSNAYCQAPHFFDLPFKIGRKVICGRNRDALEKMAATWGWDEVSTDWGAVVDRKDIDIVDVSTPNVLHAEIAIAAAGAGKIVFCEKPLALTAEEGARMVEAARNVPTMVWFNYRRTPGIAFSHKLVAGGRLGQIFHYRATYLQEWGNDPTRPPTWKTSKAEAGSGVLGDLMSHAIDAGLFLNGPIREVSAMMHTFAAGREVDDATLLLARFENGSAGTFEATRYAVGCRNQNRFEIHGSKGMLRFNLEDLNHVEFFDATGPRETEGPRRLLVANEFWKPGHVVGYEHTFVHALADFLRAHAAGEPFHPDFADAQRVQEVLHAVEVSARKREWTVVLSPQTLPHSTSK
jgi:predicted dehydrogenase